MQARGVARLHRGGRGVYLCPREGPARHRHGCRERRHGPRRQDEASESLDRRALQSAPTEHPKIPLSESEARQDFDRRIREGMNKVLTPGWDGIVLEGPMALYPKGLTGCPNRTAREVLHLAALGMPGPVSVPNR